MADLETLRTDESRDLDDGQLAIRLINALGYEFRETPDDIDHSARKVVQFLLGDVENVHALPRGGEYHLDAQPFVAEALARIVARHSGEQG